MMRSAFVCRLLSNDTFTNIILVQFVTDDSRQAHTTTQQEVVTSSRKHDKVVVTK